MHNWRTQRNWQQDFQAGDIVVFFDSDDNPVFHYSFAGRLLRGVQSVSEVGDHRAIHLGFIHSPQGQFTKPGETEMLIIDSMPPLNGEDGVAIRPLVRNYDMKIYRLKPNVTPFDSALLAKTAVQIAEKFINMSYSFDHCKDTLIHNKNRENAELNEYYTKWLCERHWFDPETKTIKPDTIDDGVNCSEFVITCYQLAVLQLSEASAAKEILPEFIGIHAHSSPAKFHNFLLTSGFYQELSPESTHALRYSGIPHPQDNSMAIIPYVPQPELPPAPASSQTWGSWLWSYVPPAPDLTYAWRLLSLLPSFSKTVDTAPVELVSGVKHTVIFSDNMTETAPKIEEILDTDNNVSPSSQSNSI